VDTKSSRLSLSARILIGLVLGVFVGLFFGEAAAVLQPVADIYIRLMQMTVLPYLVLALIIGFGQLDRDTARHLALRGGALLVLVWVLTCGVLAAMPLTFPEYESASFFSHSLVEPQRPFAFADLYFTSNPFHSLANAVIPAIVLFSCAVGVGLIGLENREHLLSSLRVVNEAVIRITKFVVGLTPVGVLAIGAVHAGTMSGETLQRLEVYLVTFAAASVLLAFWVLPLLVTAMTPFTYREVLRASRDALLTAFVTNNAFIVLPILVERSKDLLREHDLGGAESESAADVLIPVLFNFPNAGRLMTLLFIPFAAWLAGDALGIEKYPSFFLVGVSSYFAKAQVALPFLLDFMGLPHDFLQLYIPTTIIGGKFDSMVTAMNLLVFALLGAAAMAGFLELRARRLVRAGILALVGTVMTTALVQVVLAATVDTSYTQDQALRRMHAPRGIQPEIIHRDPNMVDPEESTDRSVSLERIRSRGTLRIGYEPGNLPFSFFNLDDELVGLDVELASSLAHALGVAAEFVPVAWSDVAGSLDRGVIDIMPGVWYRPFWFASLRLSEPYLTQTVGIVVRDERRHEFATTDAIRAVRGLRICVSLDASQIEDAIRHYFGNSDAEIAPCCESVSCFFEEEHLDLDGFLMPAESGAAWTLLHPEYAVVIPQPDPVELPTAFGVARDADELLDVVNEWVTFARSNGFTDRAYDYWILGRGATVDRPPRWSILRNVLGWGTPDEEQ
jgi:Na+/H+-dicarboxylate symporter/ABC-type amino acid transport substrate-binding protein